MRVTERAHMHRGNNYCFVFFFFHFLAVNPPDADHALLAPGQTAVPAPR